MHKGIKVKTLANTKWSEVSEKAIDEVLATLKRLDKHHTNIKTFIELEGKHRAVFFDFEVLTDFECVTDVEAVKIVKVYLATDTGFVTLSDLSDLNIMLLTYSALGYLRLL